MGKAAPAGSLCWYRGCPSVSGNAGAGLGLPGRAVGCSTRRRENKAVLETLRECNLHPSSFYYPQILGETESEEDQVSVMLLSSRIVCCCTTNILNNPTL